MVYNAIHTVVTRQISDIFTVVRNLEIWKMIPVLFTIILGPIILSNIFFPIVGILIIDLGLLLMSEVVPFYYGGT